MRPAPGYLLGGIVLAAASTALIAQLATSFKSPPPRPVAVVVPGAPSTVATDISGFAFPPSVTVAVDGTVTWTNADSAGHTVTFDDQALKSQSVPGGATVSVQFRAKGTYTYHCDIHSSMTGTVQVSDPSTSPESTDPNDPYGDSK